MYRETNNFLSVIKFLRVWKFYANYFTENVEFVEKFQGLPTKNINLFEISRTLKIDFLTTRFHTWTLFRVSM